MKNSEIDADIKKDILRLRDQYSGRIDQIIDGNDYEDWPSVQYAIDDCLNRLRKLIWEKIEEEL